MPTTQGSGLGDPNAPFSFESRDKIDAWSRGAAARAERLGPATELKLDLAMIRPGESVLDVAAGTGEQTILAARRVGPSGSVLATDIAAGMLAVAATAARDAGLTNVTTRVMDAQRIDLAPSMFDAAISRLGIMALPDPRAAMLGIHRVLKPGQRCAVMVFSTPERNPYTGIPTGILRRHGAKPPARGEAGPFSLGDPGQLEEVFQHAGFREIDVHTVPTLQYLPSIDEAIRDLRAKSPILRDLTAQLGERERGVAWDQIKDELRRFEGAHGFEVHGEVLVGAGTK